jgi:hypothetical protein
MGQLSYQDVHIDALGNVLGRVGSGPRVLAFDAHLDTVGITDPARWRHDPFRGVVADGTLYGRGASDQKGGLAAVVHGVALASRLGLRGRDWGCIGEQRTATDRRGSTSSTRPPCGRRSVIAMPSHLGVCRASADG